MLCIVTDASLYGCYKNDQQKAFKKKFMKIEDNLYNRM